MLLLAPLPPFHVCSLHLFIETYAMVAHAL